MSILKTAQIAFASASIISAGGTLYYVDASHAHSPLPSHHEIYDTAVDQAQTFSELKQAIAENKTDLLQAAMDNSKNAATAQDWSLGLGISATGLLGTSLLMVRREKVSAFN